MTDTIETVPFEVVGAGRTTLRGDHRPGERPTPVVLLHGGGQTRHAWARTADTLAANGYPTYTVDLRGHGDSDWAPNSDYRLDAFAYDVRAIARATPAPPVIVGASMGGISALLAAGENPPATLAGLVLVDIAPRMEMQGILRIITFMNAAPEGFADLDEAADAIATYLPGRPRPTDPSGLAKNLRHHPDGRWRWHWDPAFLNGQLRPTAAADTGRLTRAANALDTPTLLVRGRLSDLISEQGARDFLTAAPHASYIDVSDAGHMVAGDRNDAFTDAVVDFLRQLEQPR